MKARDISITLPFPPTPYVVINIVIIITIVIKIFYHKIYHFRKFQVYNIYYSIYC